MFDASASTHIGLVRKGNEDSFAANKKLGLWVVADGVGGNVHGEYASQLIVKTVERKISQGKSLKEAVMAAHLAVIQKANENHELSGMASTVVACHFKGNHYEVVWVGDSRAYLLNHQGIHQLTRDHNRAQWLVEQGEITREQSWNHPAQCQLTHAIGFDEGLHIDRLEGKLYGDEILMLCTDGLSGQLRDQQLWEIYQDAVQEVGNGALLLERVTERFIQAALDAGGQDNITLALIRLSDSAQVKFPERTLLIEEAKAVHVQPEESDCLDEENPAVEQPLAQSEDKPEENNLNTLFQKNMNQLLWLSGGIGAALVLVLIVFLFSQ